MYPFQVSVRSSTFCLIGISTGSDTQLATLMLETYYRFLPGTGEGTKNS